MLAGDESALWVPCICEGYWCTLHNDHADMCACPSLEWMDFDPYSERPPASVVEAAIERMEQADADV